MTEQIRLLQAEMRADLEAIQEAYEALVEISQRPLDQETGIIVLTPIAWRSFYGMPSG